jgi:hypothetical protein
MQDIVRANNLKWKKYIRFRKIITPFFFPDANDTEPIYRGTVVYILETLVKSNGQPLDQNTKPIRGTVGHIQETLVL